MTSAAAKLNECDYFALKHGYETLETLKGENYIITFIYLVLTSTIFKTVKYGR